MASDRTAAPADLTDEGEISHAQQVLVLALATLAEQREADSESHILRVQNYVLTLAQALAKQEQFAELLTPAYIDTLFLSVPHFKSPRTKPVGMSQPICARAVVMAVGMMGFKSTLM